MLVFKSIVGIFAIVICPRTACSFVMCEGEWHLLILSVLQDKPGVTVHELVALTKSSKDAIRRDIAALIVG